MKKIIISNPYGQLCNRLVRLAHLYAFCLENKFSLIDVYFDEYAHHFEYIKSQKIINFSEYQYLSEIELSKIKRTARNFLRLQSRYNQAHLILNLPIINKFVDGIFYVQKPETVDFMEADYMKNIFFSKEDKIFLNGWLFLAPRLIKKHRNKILKSFTPLKKYVDRAEFLITKARKNCDILIGVHIRHGDFINTISKAYHETEKYIKFMNMAKNLFRNKKVRFWICSNEKLNYDDFNGLNVNISNNEFMTDLYSLSLSDYIIGTESSFGQWAAFYGNVPYFTLRNFTKYMELEDFKIHKCVFPDWFMDVVKNSVTNNGRGYEML